MVRVPAERTCAGCLGKSVKAELLRVVRSPGGSVAVDPSGSAPGRGAYVHRDLICVASAFGRGVAIGRALRTSLSGEEAVRLRVEMERSLER